MRTVRQLIYRDVFWSVFFVAVAFLSLFFFIDFVDEVERVGRNGYPMLLAALSALLEQPGHVYELFPIAVLIGTIYSMARLAQSSEFTILRTAGLGPGRALGLLAMVGVIFGVLTFAVGEYVTPHSEQQVALLKSRFGMGLAIGRTGAWLKEHRQDADGLKSITVNVRGVGRAGELDDVRIFEVDEAGRLVRSITAERAIVSRDRNVHEWTLQNAIVTLWQPSAASAPPRIDERRAALMRWDTTLNASVAAAAVLPIQSMGVFALWDYSTHLVQEEQASQRYRQQFWKRVLYPFTCLVMVSLALPFAYLSARAGGVSVKVFGGVMLGISFILLNNVAGHLGLLHDWNPWLAASVPSLLYLLLSMSAFTWLVRYR
ncbi:MAG TPA: LPS export ABC transporter permease LptG [Burkholderiaceae bacterium]|nr:LPS export ABC transporter permease LptG [Burkholderiaceae bacterium]